MKHRHFLQRALACGLSAAMLLSLPLTGFADDSANAASALIEGMQQTAAGLVRDLDGSPELYPDTSWTSTADALPSSFDLRARGVVADVRNQGDWGTCWGFAAIAASESSILSDLGMTLEEFEAAYGHEMDLSEKHLAWFGTSHLPSLEDYPEGEYIYSGNETQAGEGIWYVDEDEDDTVHYALGGIIGYASSSFANGIGPVWEDNIPYAAADGTASTSADWSISEEYRFLSNGIELENSYFLPSPAGRDEDGNYVYHPEGTEAFKKELLAGRPVSIAFHSDQAMDPNAQRNIARDYFLSLGIPEEAVNDFFAIGYDGLSFQDATREQLRNFMYVTFIAMGVDLTAYPEEECDALLEESVDALLAEAEDPDLMEDLMEDEESFEEDEEDSDAEYVDAEALAAAEALARAVGDEIGWDYDTYMEHQAKTAEANEETYINTETYAEYTDSVYASPDHGVTIVGWDDNYPASSFPEDHQPPADGAWIVRNSWGNGYGIDGYFYLSYYDQSISYAETFDFVTNSEEVSQVSIAAYDLMEADSVTVYEDESPLFLANVFTVDHDSVLSYVSLMTAGHNTNVTAAVYLLSDDASSPTDGVLLDTVSDTFEYSGYHRLKLNQNYVLPVGARFSVVVLQRAETENGTRYAIPYTCATNERFNELFSTFDPDNAPVNWAEGKIGSGESYVRVNKTWIDWADIVAEVQEGSACASLLSYDNLSLKAYLYPLDEITSGHSFGDEIPWYNATARLCEDCGYALISVAE